MRTIWYEISFITGPFFYGAAIVIGMSRHVELTPITTLGFFNVGYWLGLAVVRWAFRKELPHMFKGYSFGK